MTDDPMTTEHIPEPCEDNPQPCGCKPCCCVLCQAWCFHMPTYQEGDRMTDYKIRAPEPTKAIPLAEFLERLERLERVVTAIYYATCREVDISIDDMDMLG